MKHINIVETTAEQLRDLRHRLLGAHLPKTRYIFPHDDLSTTKHFAAYDDDKQIGVVSVHQENCEQIPGAPVPKRIESKQGWRLRGMAVDDHYRGQGIGRALVQAVQVAILQQQAERYLWCNARLVAVDFYQRLGFIKIGQEFTVKDIGPHYVMYFFS